MRIDAAITGVFGALPVNPSSPMTPTSGQPDGVGGTSAVARVSGPGELMSRLADLQKSEPARFKPAVAQMASDLRERANLLGGARAEELSSLAERLAQVAESGDLSALRPTSASYRGDVATAAARSNRLSDAPPGGGRDAGRTSDRPGAADGQGIGGPTGGAMTPSGVQSAPGSATNYDPADDNADGTVNLAEQRNFDLRREAELTAASMANGRMQTPMG